MKKRKLAFFMAMVMMCLNILARLPVFYADALNVPVGSETESEMVVEKAEPENEDQPENGNTQEKDGSELQNQSENDSGEAQGNVSSESNDQWEGSSEENEEAQESVGSESNDQSEHSGTESGEVQENDSSEFKENTGNGGIENEVLSENDSMKNVSLSANGNLENNAENEMESESEAEMVSNAGANETESESQSQSEARIETESETETESESESEEERKYKIFVEESVLFQLEFPEEVLEYAPGEMVEFQIKPEDGYLVSGVEAYKWEDLEQTTDISEEEAGVCLPEESISVEYDEEKKQYQFCMPETDVALLVNVVSSIMTLDLAEDIEADTFKLVCSQYPDYPHAPDNMQESSLKLAMTSRKNVIFYKEDGTQIKRTAYCLQPAMDSPGSGETYDSNTAVEIEDTTTKGRNLKKALYYLYGGPVWGITVEYEDGSGSANLKELLNNNGKDCTTNDQYYCLAHYILSYIYLGESGKWNYMYTTFPESPVLNDYGVSVVKKIAAEIAKLPLAEAELSKSTATAVYNSQLGYSVSETVSYQAIKENTAKVTLPEGVVLVNETTGVKATGTVSLNGGDSFHLEAAPVVNGLRSYTLQTTYATDFTAMKLVQKGNYQDVGFSYYSGEKSLTLNVEWPKQGSLKIRKIDGETGKTESYNSHYSMENAVYGVYSDAGCTQKVTQLITGADGCASTVLPLGNYYLKEEQAPAGFQINAEVYGVSLTVPAQEAETVVVDYPVKKRIAVKKADAEIAVAVGGENGNFEACVGVTQSETLSFQGAEYTVYSDAACSCPVETLVIDENGEATTGELRLDTYYVKETKVPEGYLEDAKIYQIDMKQSDLQMVYEVVSQEQIIRGSLSLMKYLDDNMEESILQDRYDAGILEGIRFTLVHEDTSVDPVVIITDRYGYASTAEKELIYGTWYLTEDPETTPEGYEGIRNAKIEIREDGIEKMYVVTNKPYEAYLCIQKRDKASGELITVDEAEFQILDEEGAAVRMPTFGGYMDTFCTNEKGEIHLTKALKGGRYTLVETKAPEGYKLAEPLEFKVEKNAIYQEPLILECEDEPVKGRVKITKIDKNTGEHCGAGFVFQIKAAEDILDGGGNVRKEYIEDAEIELEAGAVVDVIMTNKDGIAQSRELYPGKYEICETASGEYYVCSDEVYEVEIDVNGGIGVEGSGQNGNDQAGNEQNENGQIGNEQTGNDQADSQENLIMAELNIPNEKTRLELMKIDSETETPMTGVIFALWEKYQEDTVIIAVTDENGSIAFENLKHNTSYCIQEKETLPGYVLDTTVYEFETDGKGKIADGGVWQIQLTNQPNVMEISKKDITDGEELPGALLVIKDSEGKVVEQWISGTEPHRICGLTKGSYTLTEITAPMGYEIAESIGFTLTDSLQVQKITMYDRPVQQESNQETEVETEVETEIETKMETETEKMTEKKETVVITENGNDVKTGDFTPVIAMLFLAVSSLLLVVVEVLRKIC